MKKRLISAIIAFIIVLPFFLLGGVIFELGILVLSLLSLKEVLDIFETKKEIPFFIKFLSYIFLSLFLFYQFSFSNHFISYQWISILFLVFFIPIVIYHNQEKYDIEQAFLITSSIFFLGFTFQILSLLRNHHMNYLIYILLITIITDTYAYIVGRLIGSHKLIPSISPKKTWEGLIGGTVFGTFIASVYFHSVVSFETPILIVLIMTSFLSLTGQIGDLFFSSIKRFYHKKDFSNIMPGHGGILDRLDSLLFVLMMFILFMDFI